MANVPFAADSICVSFTSSSVLKVIEPETLEPSRTALLDVDINDASSSVDVTISLVVRGTPIMVVVVTTIVVVACPEGDGESDGDGDGEYDAQG